MNGSANVKRFKKVADCTHPAGVHAVGSQRSRRVCTGAGACKRLVLQQQPRARHSTKDAGPHPQHLIDTTKSWYLLSLKAGTAKPMNPSGIFHAMSMASTADL